MIGADRLCIQESEDVAHQWRCCKCDVFVWTRLLESRNWQWRLPHAIRRHTRRCECKFNVAIETMQLSFITNIALSSRFFCRWTLHCSNCKFVDRLWAATFSKLKSKISLPFLPMTCDLMNFGIRKRCFAQRQTCLSSRRSWLASMNCFYSGHHVVTLIFFSKSEIVWGRRCYGFQFLPTSAYLQAVAQQNIVPSVGGPITNFQGVKLPNVYFYSPTVHSLKTSSYGCALFDADDFCCTSCQVCNG